MLELKTKYGSSLPQDPAGYRWQALKPEYPRLDDVAIENTNNVSVVVDPGKIVVLQCSVDCLIAVAENPLVLDLDRGEPLLAAQCPYVRFIPAGERIAVKRDTTATVDGVLRITPAAQLQHD